MRHIFDRSFFCCDRMPSKTIRPFSRVFLSCSLFIVTTIFVASVCDAAGASPIESKGLRLLEEIQAAISHLAERVTPTVVGVSTIRQLSQSGKVPRQSRFRTPGSGSGVIIHEDGYIVTNDHVINNGVEAEVHFSDQSTLIAEIIAHDPDTDLALLKVEADHKLPSATFGDSGTVKVGQWVLAVGNPFGLDRTVTLGVVSGIGRENMNLSRYENFIQTDASINPGNSGGPLFNLRGEVIGINTAIINLAQGIGFAIPSNMASRIIDQLKTGGKVVRGWLGVGIQPLTAQLADKFGVPDGKGILVNEVFADDPADHAGIKSGDIITQIGNERLESPNQLSRVVAGFSPGEKVLVHIIRDRRPLQLPVFLGVKKDKSIEALLPPTPAEVDLGIDVSPVTEELAKNFSIEQTTGILVLHVTQGSIAYTEGLRRGDIIREVNRAEVPTMKEFRQVLKAIQPGETILLRILRESRTFFVVLKPQS